MDEILGCLAAILWLPYEVWKRMTGESRTGTSRMDRDTGLLYRRIAIAGTAVLGLLGLAWWVLMG